MLDRALPATAFALVLGCAAAFAGPGRPSPIGRWLTADDGGVIEIAPCGTDQLCGRIVGMTRDHPRDPEPTDFRGQPQCGLTIIRAARQTGPNEWTGSIEDPRNGRQYHALLSLDDDGRLRVRGYVGLPLFGETVIWRPFGGNIADHCEIVAPELPQQVTQGRAAPRLRTGAGRG